jgi:hypothetical protein
MGLKAAKLLHKSQEGNFFSFFFKHSIDSIVVALQQPT